MSADFDLLGWGQDRLYDHLEQVINKERKRDEKDADAAYVFQTEPGRMNLLAARGFLMNERRPTNNTNSAWDDTLFLIYKDAEGNKQVSSFMAATEFSVPRTTPTSRARPLLIAGMHQYWLNFHHKMKDGVARPVINIFDCASYPGSAYQYRALNPLKPVRVIRDEDEDLIADEGEARQENATINVHYGGKNPAGPSNWSHGCTVLYGWGNYKRFIELIKSDPTVARVDKDADGSNSTRSGQRALIYTLVPGTALAPAQAFTPLVGKSTDQLYALNEDGGDGLFPIGRFGLWHGGVHLRTPGAVQAVLDGNIVAYRINSLPLEAQVDGSSLPYSNSFVLMRHACKTPKGGVFTFFSLYMHLLPYGSYSDKQKQSGPDWMHTGRTLTVACKRDGRGLNLRDAADKSKVVTVLPFQARVTVDSADDPPADHWSRGKDGSKRYQKLSFQGHSGYAYLRGGRGQVFPDGSAIITTEEDSPAADQFGMCVTQSGQGSEVLEVLVAGSAIEPKRPNELMVAGKPVAGWHELATGGWIWVKDTGDVVLASSGEPERYDSVEQVDIPVKAGEILGHAGPYLASPALLHFEVFCEDLSFMDNPSEDVGGKRWLQLPAATTFYKRGAVDNPAIEAVLPAGSRLEVLERGGDYCKVRVQSVVGWAKRDQLGAWKKPYYQPSVALAALSSLDGGPADVPIDAPSGATLQLLKQKGDHRKVAFALPPERRAALTGWLTAAELASGEAHTVLKRAVGALYTHHPDSCACFDEPAGDSELPITEELPADHDPRLCRDRDDKQWLQVEYAPGRDGWVEQAEALVVSAFDWPQWTQLEESGGYSCDGVCDLPGLLDQLDVDRDGIVQHEEMALAVGDSWLASRLRRIASKHPTEWDASSTNLDRLKEPPYVLSDAKIEETKAYIEQLQWWPEVSDSDLPAPESVWHLHPIGFLEQMVVLVSGGLRVVLDEQDEPAEPAGPPPPAEPGVDEDSPAPADGPLYGGYTLTVGDRDSKHRWEGEEQAADEGSYVEELQRDLLALGYWISGSAYANGMLVDGSFGGGVSRAVKLFQREHELGRSGVVDAAAATKIKDAVSAGAPRPTHDTPYGPFLQLSPSNDFIHHDFYGDEAGDVPRPQVWGKQELIDFIPHVAAKWLAEGRKKLLVTDLSIYDGGPFVVGGGNPRHKTHTDGTSFDLDSNVYCSINKGAFDRHESLELAKLLIDCGATRVLFNCKFVIDSCDAEPAYKGKACACAGHDNHMHVDLSVTTPPPVENLMYRCRKCAVYLGCTYADKIKPKP